MAGLASMPPIRIRAADLRPYGKRWATNGEKLTRTPPESSAQLGALFEGRAADALAIMLGSLPIVTPLSTALTPPQPNCVEKGNVRIIGGVRPQNFDVVYRPDGVRFALDAKTLNDKSSVAKNYQNMINDLATEATTVHSRFPYALVAFVVVIPSPCLVQPQSAALIGTLERLSRRFEVDEPAYWAEAISLVVWDPATGRVSKAVPNAESALRIEKFSSRIEAIYRSRYEGLPPHTDSQE